MNTMKPSVEIIDMEDYDKIVKKIEKIGRVCYKSEGSITDDSAERFISNILKRGHESVIEHEAVTVRMVCDRGVTHEIVRHRIASYSQESTRYCNYAGDKFGNQISVIDIAGGFHYDLTKENDKAYKQKNERHSIICRELLGLDTDQPTVSAAALTGAVPEARTPEYYKKRPCLELIGDACDIIDSFINQ